MFGKTEMMSGYHSLVSAVKLNSLKAQVTAAAVIQTADHAAIPVATLVLPLPTVVILVATHHAAHAEHLVAILPAVMIVAMIAATQNEQVFPNGVYGSKVA